MLVVKLVVSAVLLSVTGIVVILVMTVVLVLVTGTVFAVDPVVMSVDVTTPISIINTSGRAVILTRTRRRGYEKSARGVAGDLGTR